MAKKYFVFFTDLVTQLKDGIMSAADKKKLDGIEEKANNYAHPATSGNRHIPSGGSSGKILRWSGDGTAAWGDDKDTTYFNATQSASGLMSAADKKKLDGIAEEANKTTIDAALSKTSTNPVQNKVVAEELETIKKSVGNGKTAVADAITRMGVTTAADAAFATMASNIAKISTGVDTTDATALAAEILTGKTAYVNEIKVTGTMPNQGARTAALDCGGSYTIPAGYHNGSGKVTANSLASQTVATATSGEILTGETAYVNGQKVTGTMPNQGAKTAALNCGGSYTIPAGYHNGSGKVTVNSLASQTAATLAGSGQLRKGVTAFSNGTKYTGSMAELAAAAYTPGTADQEIAAGQFLAGKQTIRGDAKLVAGNIKSGVTIFGVSGIYGSDMPWMNPTDGTIIALPNGDLYEISGETLNISTAYRNIIKFPNGAVYLVIKVNSTYNQYKYYLNWYPLKGAKPNGINLISSVPNSDGAAVMTSSSGFSITYGTLMIE